MGYLSQYFCVRRTLEDELALLRNMNSTSDDSVASKQKEIDDATRDAYLYATGMVIAIFSLAFIHAWGFYLAQNVGMQARIIAIGAIYNKVRRCIL